MTGKKVFIVIPAYNEAKAISKVLDDLKKNGYRNIIVVDDCSSDDTAIVARHHKAIVLKHIINRGQGAALKTGTDAGLNLGAEFIVHFDADGQMRVVDIKKLLTPLIAKKADVVLGSRFLGQKAKNMPFSKKISLQLGRIVVFALYGLWLSDSQSGFRVINRKAAQNIKITADRMEHAGEILGEIKKKKLRLVEVAVTILYTDYSIQKGQSWSRGPALGLKMLLRRLLK
ncbi:glycosyltransferase family 2 protein [Candidatus Woesearchaeota archaeon]|nr:glycosyltransferase family 2 protein [Candidatus Woesearchaeota archaeon]